jgi:broad specificity phosphatase PhoE
MWLLFLVAAALVYFAYRSATTTTVVLVRHAEQELGTIEDAPLSAAGERRAEHLAQVFGDVSGPGRIDAIYVSDTRRAQQTAMPLAMRLGVRPMVLPATQVDAVVSRILHDHRGGRALVVGHSNTLPEIVQRLSGVSIPPIGEDQYDNIYVVTVPTFGKASVLQLKY